MPRLGRYDTLQGSFPAAAAIAVNRRVKLNSSGKVEVAGASDAAIGTADRASNAANDVISVRFVNAPTHEYVASGVIAVGAAVFAAASGKVAGTGTIGLGTALTDSGADGDVILVAPTK